MVNPVEERVSPHLDNLTLTSFSYSFRTKCKGCGVWQDHRSIRLSRNDMQLSERLIEYRCRLCDCLNVIIYELGLNIPIVEEEEQKQHDKL